MGAKFGLTTGERNHVEPKPPDVMKRVSDIRECEVSPPSGKLPLPPPPSRSKHSKAEVPRQNLVARTTMATRNRSQARVARFAGFSVVEY